MRLFVVLTAALLAPLPAHGETATDARQLPVVYGVDDRAEPSEHPDPTLQALARSSIVALVPRAAVAVDLGGAATLSGRPLGESQGLCPGERFADQPASALCSGTLIAPDLVLTAGHCFPSAETCGQIVAVLGYEWTGGGLAPLTVDDVYACTRLVAHAESESGGETMDYAVFQLDRAVVGRAPANVAATTPALSAGDPLVMIGSPSGIPMKIDDGGQVRDPRADVGDVFVATTDSFGGNSGSGVFNADTLELIGILISGDTDYVDDGGCQRVNVCAENGCDGENVMVARHAIEELCGFATDEVLCGTGASCGDAFCAYDETPETCASDCTPAVCGDAMCSGSEWLSCPDDCVAQIPPEWTCDPTYYGTLDGCDCMCGAPDPDCDLGQEVLNCSLGEVCDEDGTCTPDVSLCDCTTNRRASRQGAFALAMISLLAFGARSRLPRRAAARRG